MSKQLIFPITYYNSVTTITTHGNNKKYIKAELFITVTADINFLRVKILAL